MTPVDSGASEKRLESISTMPRRDFVLIPSLVIATIMIMLMTAEVTARVMFADRGHETCEFVGASGMPQMRPNCVSYRKAPESPMVENAYNDCGYRTPTSCGIRPAGTLRVALLGTSFAQGFKIPYNETFAARLTDSLTKLCGRPVEFQNMGIPGLTMLDNYRRMGKALAMAPDLVMLVLTAGEMKAPLDPAKLAARDELLPADDSIPAALGKEPQRPEALGAPVTFRRSLVAWLSDLAVNSRALVMAQHFLFQDRATYVRLYMLHGDDAGYLRPPFGPTWEQPLANFDQLLRGMAEKAHKRGVPMVLVDAPAMIQVSLLSEDAQAYGADPFAFGRRLEAIAARADVPFIDALTGFSRNTPAEKLFYPVDGHMNAEGSAEVAKILQQRLTSIEGSPFAACRSDQRAESQSSLR